MIKTIIALALCLAGCAATNQLTAADESDLGVLTAEVALCNAQPAPATCKAQVKALFDAKEAAKFADAGVSQ
jgi:uncharacterized lipoprotein NlpE involved in copper resistance